MKLYTPKNVNLIRITYTAIFEMICSITTSQTKSAFPPKINNKIKIKTKVNKSFFLYSL